ncbi:hypothetical protein DVG78_01985 [Runella aurantiaca]|uniref:Uncharacterized protein n=2 Tax=Runella aurantiaca TaxID=2282308 RepID=A0A369IMI1_9BACT|nr:hypothetical protein DVG78_01985 [Runella aurantiaca]
MEQDSIASDYLKRFNEGYTIAKYMPELAEQLTKAIQDHPNGTGFQQGRAQFMSEQLKEKVPSWLKGERPGKQAVSPDKQKSKDIEPEP